MITPTTGDPHDRFFGRLPDLDQGYLDIMSDPFPWGAVPPAKRVSDLERQIEKLARQRASAAEAYRKTTAAFDESEKSLRASLKQAHGYAEKQMREEAAQAVARTVERLMAAGKIPADLLSSSTALEQAVTAALAKPAPAKKSAAKAG